MLADRCLGLQEFLQGRRCVDTSLGSAMHPSVIIHACYSIDCRRDLTSKRALQPTNWHKHTAHNRMNSMNYGYTEGSRPLSKSIHLSTEPGLYQYAVASTPPRSEVGGRPPNPLHHVKVQASKARVPPHSFSEPRKAHIPCASSGLRPPLGVVGGMALGPTSGPSRQADIASLS